MGGGQAERLAQGKPQHRFISGGARNLFEEGTLRDVKVQFWRRYKAKYPVGVSPSDQLLSRCYRETDKRLLTIYNIWKVKTLLHQVTSTKKRKQVGTDLCTFEDEAEENSVWRKPRQPESPPPNVASSSPGGNPVKLEPVAVDSDGADVTWSPG